MLAPDEQTFFLEKQPKISLSLPEEKKKQDSKENEENSQSSNDDPKQGLQPRRA